MAETLAQRLGRFAAGLRSPRWSSNEAIRVFLLEKAGFAVVPFQAFGLEQENGWFRLSVGAVSLEQIAEALPRVEAAIRDLLAR